MTIQTKDKKMASIKLPLSGLRPLYRTSHGKKVVLEVDVSALRAINESNTIDEMVGEARLEYFSGKTKGFRNIKKLLAHLGT
ncbi:MAG: hypothetical protein Q8L47_04965 [bacterium]|nr:hypothetical protein [bacterium]